MKRDRFHDDERNLWPLLAARAREELPEAQEKPASGPGGAGGGGRGEGRAHDEGIGRAPRSPPEGQDDRRERDHHRPKLTPSASSCRCCG